MNFVYAAFRGSIANTGISSDFQTGTFVESELVQNNIVTDINSRMPEIRGAGGVSPVPTGEASPPGLIAINTDE